MMNFVTQLGRFTMQFISREACEISHMLQVNFVFLHHAKSHEGHEGNEGRMVALYETRLSLVTFEFCDDGVVHLFYKSPKP